MPVDKAQKEIKRAKDLYTQYKDRILRDENCVIFLKNYGAAIGKNLETMRNLDIDKSCAMCSETRMGGCCASGIEKWYEHVLLLVNLLMGVDLGKTGEIGGCCMFLGSTGCILAARHSFCVNYMCEDLKNSLSPSSLKILMTRAGEEISCGILAEQAISGHFMIT